MNKRPIRFAVLALSATFVLSAMAIAKTVSMLPGEEWYGVATHYGLEMPFTEKTELAIDLREDGWRNQYASLLLSSRGCVIWCDRQAGFVISGGEISVTADAPKGSDGKDISMRMPIEVAVLPKGEMRFEVVARNCFGVAGRPLQLKYKL